MIQQLQYRNTSVPPVLSRLESATLDLIWLELTRKCNLQCMHCYADSDPSLALVGAMTLENWKTALLDARQLGCQRVQFIGGEVLLVPYLEALVQESRALEYSSVEVFTNATVVTSKTIEYFKQYGVRVATSFYSCDAAVHDSITQTPGSWNKTVQALAKLQEAELLVRVGVITSAANEHGLDDTLAFVRRIGITDVGVDRVRSIGRGQALGRGEGYPSELCGQCGRARLCITAEGDVLPCIMARQTRLGNWLNAGGLEHCISWSELASFRADLADAKRRRGDGFDIDQANCTPDCWPHGGCAPHDICKPHGK